MKIGAITIGFHRTINLGNFENIRVQAEVVVELEKGETITTVMDKAQAELRGILDATYTAQHRPKHPPPAQSTREPSSPVPPAPAADPPPPATFKPATKPEQDVTNGDQGSPG